MKAKAKIDNFTKDATHAVGTNWTNADVVGHFGDGHHFVKLF